MTRDRFGRSIHYLRISLTDRCNLRCRYCMPLHGLQFAEDEALLQAEEIETVARAAARVGFVKLRLTGGEPTLRRDLVDIVRRIRSVPEIADLAMTTNGYRMRELAAPLKAAGLDRVNVHVDSLDPERLPALMRLGELDEILSGIEACEAAGLRPVKINTVVARGYNEEDVVEIARLTRERAWAVRFIELMPLGAGEEAQFSLDRYVPSAEVKARIEAALGPLEPLPNRDPADESVNHRLAGARGTVGFISPVSAPYCDTCNRMRLTADGRFHLCLLHEDELDVRAVLRAEHPDAEARLEAVAQVLRRAIAAKPTGHALREGVYTESRRMHALGG